MREKSNRKQYQRTNWRKDDSSTVNWIIKKGEIEDNVSEKLKPGKQRVKIKYTLKEMTEVWAAEINPNALNVA